MAGRIVPPGPGQPPSVSRVAYYGGLALGIGTAVGGYYAVPAVGFTGGAAAMVELAIVALAMGITFGIWKISATVSDDEGRSSEEGEGV